MNILGVDIGGSGIKGALVDIVHGEMVSERIRIPSPPDFLPEDVVATTVELIRQFDYEGPVGVGFPSVVMNGMVTLPATSFQIREWINYPIADKIQDATGVPTCVLNDGDVAGMAEMTFGAGQNTSGVVMLFTLGTGIGSVLFVDGRLVPNLELGHLYLRDQKQDAEYQTAERVRKEQNLSWKAWGQRLDTYFKHIERLFSPDLIIIGGGVSKKHERFLKYIDIRAQILPAQLRNQAGIIGAALAAHTM